MTDLKAGDIVEQTQNGGWWFMHQDNPNSRSSLIGVCVRVPHGWATYELGSTSLFSKSARDGSWPRTGVVLREEHEVPDDVWREIARLALEGKM